MRTVYKTYKYKLYSNKKNKHLDETINIASEIWNFCIAMKRMYYRMYGKNLSATTLKKYITKLKKRKAYTHWNKLGSQAIQDVAERVERSYDAFFKHKKENRKGRKSLPHFCKKEDYKSFTLKQAGYSFGEGNKITIMGREYKYVNSRSFEGEIKTLTVKRNNHGEFFIYVVVKTECNDIYTRAGNAAGIDFGMKQFLTLDNGTSVESPLWYKAALKSLRKAHRKLSKCQLHSNNWYRAKRELDKLYIKISNQRRDWFFKLANKLVEEYAIICIEDLNLQGMQKLWGRKINDLAFSEFVFILEWVASNAGTTVIKVDRWTPTSQMCNVCGMINPDTKNLALRKWTCDCCHTHHDRDINAAINIKNAGLALLRAS